MPIYEYKCQACGHHFEKIVKLNETPNCPSCDSGELEKQFSMAAVSTSRTRSSAFNKARSKAGEIKKEKDHAQAVYERNYIKDHS
ncbi:MAG: putative FmdB family regulatory protein [Pseudohongiellaceae bacterium]|jgi:putative FmdB family regulatory protein